MPASLMVPFLHFSGELLIEVIFYWRLLGRNAGFMLTWLQDVAAKILAFSQQGPRTVFILSANGSISNATLRHSMTSGGSVTYEVLIIVFELHS